MRNKSSALDKQMEQRLDKSDREHINFKDWSARLEIILVHNKLPKLPVAGIYYILTV